MNKKSSELDAYLKSIRENAAVSFKYIYLYSLTAEHYHETDILNREDM